LFDQLATARGGTMSGHYDTSTEFDPGPMTEDDVLERPEPFANDPLLPIPQVQAVPLAGDYVAAVLSVTGNPEGNNLAEQVKVRTILAVDVPSLQPQVVACLISDFGLNQEQAEFLAEQAKPDLPGRLSRGRDAPEGLPLGEEEDPPLDELMRHQSSWDSPQREA
jgi:hypothetical protein